MLLFNSPTIERFAAKTGETTGETLDKSVATAAPNVTVLTKLDFEYNFFIKPPPTEHNIITARKNPHGKTLFAHKKQTNKDRPLPLRCRHSLRHHSKISEKTLNLEKSPTLLARGIQTKK